MKNSTFLFALIVSLFLTLQPTDLLAQLTFTNANTSDGLGNNRVRGIFAEGMNVYPGTDGGNTFINKTTADGLGHNFIWDIEVDGLNVYAGTNGGGLAISTDGGNTFTTKTTADGLAHDAVRSMFIDGSTWYLGTDNRVTISTDGGATFSISAPVAGGIFGLYLAGSTIYAGPNSGPLQISTDGGTTFSTLSGSGNEVYGVYVVGMNIYLATNASSSGFRNSTDGGTSFTNYTTSNGLGNIRQDNVFIDATAQTVYVATCEGISKATDTSLPAPESSWSIADITTDCDSDGGTYDICFSAADLGDVIGLDVGFSYPSQLTPVATDFITLKDLALNPVGGDVSQIDVFENTDIEREISASVYFNSGAPLAAVWSGGGEFSI